MKIVAHRGTPGMHEDNTEESLVLAVDCQVDVVEFDLQVTQDGELAVFHDDSISIGENRHKISETSLVELKNISPNILDIDEAIEVITNRSEDIKIMIDCKGKNWQSVLSKKLRQYANSGVNYDRFIVLSFYASQLKKFQSMCPSVMTFYLYRSRPFIHLFIAKFFGFSGAGYYVTLGYIGWPPKIAKLFGLQLYFFNVNTVDHARKCEKAGIQYVGTDRASVLVPAIKGIKLSVSVSTGDNK